MLLWHMADFKNLTVGVNNEFFANPVPSAEIEKWDQEFYNAGSEWNVCPI